MKTKTPFIIAILIGIISIQITNAQVSPQKQWSQYRGQMADGYLNNTNIPDSWDLETGENIKWQKEIPGLGLSSPVIWGDKLFITTAVSQTDNSGYETGIFGDIMPVMDSSIHVWKTLCIHRQTGETLWEQDAYTGIPLVKRHPKSSHANCTNATNGEYVISFFGSEGLYCYDMDGTLVWDENFGKMESVFFAMPEGEWEFASSPIIYNDVVIIQVDILKNSFVAALDIKTGNLLWKTERDEYPGWCTPNIYKDGDKTRIAINGFKHRGAYDFETGKEIWKMSGGGDIPVPTPLVANDMIYFNSAHGKSSPILAISNEAKGDITLEEGKTTNEFVKWSWKRGGAYMNTMLIYGDNLYNLRWNGMFYCIDAKSGDEKYKLKVGDEGSFITCPVATDNKIYFADDEGMVFTIKAGDEYELLHKNSLNDICMTTPAIAKDAIYFRTVKYLIAIGE